MKQPMPAGPAAFFGKGPVPEPFDRYIEALAEEDRIAENERLRVAGDSRRWRRMPWVVIA